MAEFYCNNPATTLASAISSALTTSIIVTSSSGYPSTGNFRIKIDNEIMIVTAVTGTTWTVTRGAESTTAATHAPAAVVNQVLTAGAIDGFRATQSQFGPYASLPSTSLAKLGDQYKCSDAPYNFFYNGSGWQALLNGIPVTVPPTILDGRTTTLNTSMNSSVTTMVVTANFSSMPSTPFWVLVGTEQMQVTAVSGTSWTVARGDGGTTAASQTSGVTISLMTFSLTFATSNTLFTQGQGSWTFENTAQYDGHDYCLLLKTPLAYSAPYTVILGFSNYNAIGGNFIGLGLGLWDSSNAGKSLTFAGNFYLNTWFGPTNLQSWSGPGNYFGSLSGTVNYNNSGSAGAPQATDGSPMFQKFVDNGTNWLCYFSYDMGMNWTLVSTNTRNSFISPEYIGPYVSPRSYRVGMKVLSFQQLSGVY